LSGARGLIREAKEGEGRVGRLRWVEWSKGQVGVGVGLVDPCGLDGPPLGPAEGQRALKEGLMAVYGYRGLCGARVERKVGPVDLAGPGAALWRFAAPLGGSHKLPQRP
jgi:hypothetical protein